MKFKKYLENMSTDVGGTFTSDIAPFARKIGTPVKRLYPDLLGTEPYEATFKKNKKSKSKRKDK